MKYTAELYRVQCSSCCLVMQLISSWAFSHRKRIKFKNRGRNVSKTTRKCVCEDTYVVCICEVISYLAKTLSKK